MRVGSKYYQRPYAIRMNRCHRTGPADQQRTLSHRDQWARAGIGSAPYRCSKVSSRYSFITGIPSGSIAGLYWAFANTKQDRLFGALRTASAAAHWSPRTATDRTQC